MSMRKLSVVAVALLLSVSATYASWSYFPPKDAGSGEAKIGFDFGIPAEKVTEMGLSVGASYSIIEGLEASVILPVPLSYSIDGNSAEDYAGLSMPVIGVRYWLPMGLGFFVDAYLPVDTRDGMEPPMVLGVGAQYSMNFTEELSFGSQLGLVIPFAKETELMGETIKYADGMDLTIGVELDYSLGMVTPFLGFDMAMGVTKASTEISGVKVESPEAAPMGMDLTIGAAFEINEMFEASVSFGIGFGDRYGDNTPMAIGASFSFHF